MNTRRPTTRRRRRGIFITDAVIGLSLLAVLLTIAAITLGYDHRARRAAVDHRRLTHAAEAALLALQQGQTADDALHVATREAQAADIPLVVTLQRLPDGDMPDGRHWVRATASHRGQSIDLVGLVPTESAEGLEEATIDSPTGETP